MNFQRMYKFTIQKNGRRVKTMSLQNVQEELNLIAKTPSTNDKIRLLKESLKDDLFRKVVKYALSKDMKYKIKKFQPFKGAPKGLLQNDVDIALVFEYLKQLSAKPGVSNADKQKLFDMLTDRPTYEVVRRICTKDLKIGADARTINKARPGTVNVVPYMRCSTVKKIGNIDFSGDGAFVQEKADGTFVNVMINSLGQIKIITRNGRIVYGLHSLKHAILRGRKKQVTPKGIADRSGILNSQFRDSYLNSVYNGELIVVVNGITLDRKTGNGIINKCIHGTATKEERDCVHLRVWDTLPLDKFYNGFHEVHYNTRHFDCRSFVNAVNSPRVQMVETKRVKSLEEAWKFYYRMREEGKEGAVLKNAFTQWKDHTSTNQVKMKNVIDAELTIVGWYRGNVGTYFEKCVGGIICESRCKKLRVKVGSGLSHADRGFKIVKKKHKNAMLVMHEGFVPVYIDKKVAKKACQDMQKRVDSNVIAGLEAESVIKDKRNKKLHSLFLPRLVEYRFDKDEADSLRELQER